MRLLALAVTLVALTQRAVPEALAQEHTEYPHLAQGFTAALDLPPEGHAQGDRQVLPQLAGCCVAVARPVLEAAVMTEGVDLVGSHGRWKRPCLQTAHMTL
jgi:hypothetical protein